MPYARKLSESTGYGALAILLALSGGGIAQEPEIGAPGYNERTDTDPARFNLEIKSKPLSRVSVDFSETLEGMWRQIMPPMTSLDGRTPMSIPLTDLGARGFFRAVVEPPRIGVFRENGELVVEVFEEGVEFDELLSGLSRELPDFPFYSLPYSPDSEETHAALLLPAVQKGRYSGVDLEHLGHQMGIRFWEAAPRGDDEKLADAYIPLGRDQGKPVDLPGDGGNGEIDDGWEGDNIREVPEEIFELPEPGKFDMPFIEKVDEVDEQVDPLDLDPGRHVRLRLRYDGINFSFERAIAQTTGSGILDKPFPIPPEGTFVLVVIGPDGGIQHIFPFEDPRVARSYNPPQGGSHGHEMSPEGSTRLTLPILGDDIEKTLEGLQLHILEVKAIPDGDATLLTPELIERHPNNFPLVGGATGPEISKLLREGGPRVPKAVTKPAEVTTIHRSGSNASKFNIAVMAEGFRDTISDQNLFNNFVQNVVMDTLLTRDIHPSVINGINLFRVNTFSEQSGVTLVNSTGGVTLTRSTALEYRFSGIWNRCWMEPGPNSQALLDAVVDDVCPQADFVIVIMNNGNFGGCARGNHFAVTTNVGWQVVAHEFGHKPGTLGDEYTCGTTCGCYSDGEPGAPNLTSNTTRASLKWNMWVPSWRPLPTTLASIASNTQDVGLFPGATIGQGQWTSCIFRPSAVGRMNDNLPVHNPIGHTNVREQFRPYQKADFRRNAVGDFNGDGRSDIVLQDDRQLSLFISGDRNVGPNDPVRGSPPRSVTGVLTPTWYHTNILWNTAQTRRWVFRSTDILIPGDFDGDGLDDLYVINLDAWNIPYVCLLKSFGDRFEPVAIYGGDLPGWQMRSGDRFMAGDFNGDGRDDLMVYNGSNWDIPYFGMLRSTGSGLQMTRRYDKFLPGWEMGRHERFSIADFNGDGRADIVAFNTQSWSQVHLMTFTSNGSQLSLRDRYYGTIPKFWQMRRNDQLHVLDFSGDGKSDIAIFNGRDWGPVYLGYLQGEDGKLTGRTRYNSATNPIPGWQLQRRDRFHVANVDGDADDDLVVYNKDNWSTQYLGILKSSPASTFTVQGSWQADWINGWNLGPSDQFKTVEFRGAGKWDDMYVFNSGWFGLLRGYKTHFRLETIYRKWIFNHRYHASGWW